MYVTLIGVILFLIYLLKWKLGRYAVAVTLMPCIQIFLQLVRVFKPTGDTECPPQVEHAHQIDWFINEKAGTWELDNSKIIDAIEDYGDGDDNGDEDAAISISSNSEDVTKQITHCKSASVKVEAAVPSLGPHACRSMSNQLDTPSASTCNTRMVKNTPTNLLNSTYLKVSQPFSQCSTRWGQGCAIPPDYSISAAVEPTLWCTGHIK